MTNLTKTGTVNTENLSKNILKERILLNEFFFINKTSSY